MKPYTNVYALLDDKDEVIKIQKVEFTKENIAEDEGIIQAKKIVEDGRFPDII